MMRKAHEVPLARQLVSSQPPTIAARQELGSMDVESSRPDRNSQASAVLADVSHTLAEARLDYRHVLELVARSAVDLLGDSCVLTALSEDHQRLTPVFFHHRNPQALELMKAALASSSAELNQGAASTVARTGRPVLIPDVPAERSRAPMKPEYSEYVDLVGVQSLLIVPLAARGEIIGTMGMSRDFGGQPFTADDQLFLQQLADRSALAIANAQLYESAQKELAERRRAEKALRESEAQLNNAQRIAHLGSWWWDPRTDERHWSVELYRILGLDLSAPAPSQEQLLPYYTPDSRARLQAAIDAARTSGIASAVELEYVHPDGSIRYHTVLGEPVRDAAGNVVRLQGTIQDITESKLAERHTARLSAALESATDLVALIDASGHGLYINRSGRALLGFRTDEDITQHQLHELIAGPDARVRAASTLNEAIATGSARAEFAMSRPGAGEVLLAVTVTRHCDEAGEVAFLSVIAKDVTEYRRLEERVAESRKLEWVGQLAGGVAHDFNNVLSIITGYVGMALEQLPPHDALRALLEPALQGAERAASLTSQLLAFGRRQVLSPRALDLNDVLRGLEPMVRGVLDESITLRLSLAPDLGAVNVDPIQIERVLLNLVLHARDAMPGGGTLTIETKRIERCPDGLDTECPCVSLTVKDTGDGMDSETKSRIFEPFFSSQRAGNAPGLGLATVYGIVKQSEGTISVESTPGEGTAFQVLLPRRTEPGSAQHPAAPEAPGESAGEGSAAPATLLVVDDEAPLRALIRRVLTRAGLRVLTAADAKEAMSLLQASNDRIDMLLTDVVLPGLSGPELAAEMLRERPSLQILYMSGYAPSLVGLDKLDKPELHFLPKPFTVDTLRERVSALLSRTEQP